MSLYESVKTKLNEADENLVTAEEVKGDVFNCLEMYSEDQWNGADDDYAQEVFEQNLYDVILSILEKHAGLTFDEIVKLSNEGDYDPSYDIYDRFLGYVYVIPEAPDPEAAAKTFADMCNDAIKLYKSRLEEAEIHTVDNDPAWAAAVAKVNAQYDEAKPEIINDIKSEYKATIKGLKADGWTDEELDQEPAIQALRDAMKDPDDIWCECGSNADPEYKEDGELYLGVSKHGWICPDCMKYQQIG